MVKKRTKTKWFVVIIGMEVGVSSHFIKRARRLSKAERDELDERTEWFQVDPNDPRLKMHALTGNLKGCFSFSITRGKRVKFIFVNKDKVLFIDVGSHEEIYG